MNILNDIAQTISNFIMPKSNYVAPAPQYVPPPQPINPKAQLQAIYPVIYYGKYLESMSESEAAGRVLQYQKEQQKQSERQQGALQVDSYRQQNINIANQIQSQNMQKDSQWFAWEARQKQLLSEPYPEMGLRFM